MTSNTYSPKPVIPTGLPAESTESPFSANHSAGPSSKRLEFSRKTRDSRFTFSGGICEAVWSGKRCNMPIGPGNVEYHHEKEAVDGGDNSFKNCRAVCIACHKILTAIFVKAKAKAERQRANQLNCKPSSPRGFPKQPKIKQPSRHIHEPPRRQLYVNEVKP